MKVLARSIQIPICAISQLSRECERRENKRPMLSDLRDSGAIEQDADLVVFMYYQYTQKETDNFKGEIIVGKHRDGPTGVVYITNNKEIQRIYDASDVSTEDLNFYTILDEHTAISKASDVQEPDDDFVPF